MIYIPIEQLRHHPKNPRLDLGDLKELTASIKAKGVMQNLTVVPNPADDETWLVVIGNRRFEASKAAGLTELPCVISDMDEKEQLATMLMENMQRVDLTMMEQVGGIQMMLDLGMTDAEISKSTGLRKDTIARRRTIMKYDAAKAEAGFSRGATLQDFAKLEQVEDEKSREKLLEVIGSPNYANDVANILRSQKEKAVRQQVADKLETWATKIDRHGYVGERNQPMKYVNYFYGTEGDLKKAEPADDVKEVRYYYLITPTNIGLYKESDVTPSSENQERERLRQALEERAREADAICQRHYELRTDFIANGQLGRIDQNYLLQQMIFALENGCYTRDTNALGAALGVDVQQKSAYSYQVDQKGFRKAVEEHTSLAALAMLNALLGRRGDKPYETVWVSPGQEIRHKRNPNLERCYEILARCGYQISDEEKAMLDGTHEVYKKVRV